MSWIRWMFYVVALWSICTVWADDQMGMTSGTPQYKFYWALVAVVGVVALILELRDTRKAATAE